MLRHLFHNIKVNDFCETATGEYHTHNWFNPTRQNLMCYGQSAWEVINQHEDFQNLMPMEDTLPPETLFRVLRPGSTTRYVLVLDTSGSMNDPKEIRFGNPRIKRLQEASTKWIKYDVNDGDQVGVVRFR